MRKRILFLDIDGTLYSGKSGRVPESAMASLLEARENGSRIFLCTGRSHAEAKPYLGYPVDGFIFSSGSCVEINGDRIYDRPIEPEQVKRIARIIEDCGFGVLIGGYQKSCLDWKCRAAVRTYFSGPGVDDETALRDLEANGMYPMEAYEETDPVYKLGAGKPHAESFEPLIRQLPEPFRLFQTMSSEQGDFGDISDATVMKKDGIQRVLDYLGESAADAAAIGDSGNDVDMLEICGIGIAMGNGTRQVKQVADWITSDIEEDGIRNAFRYLDVI